MDVSIAEYRCRSHQNKEKEAKLEHGLIEIEKIACSTERYKDQIAKIHADLKVESSSYKIQKEVNLREIGRISNESM